MLYSKLTPNGDVTIMVPVGARQVGCTVADATGAFTFGLMIIAPDILLVVVHPPELVILQ